MDAAMKREPVAPNWPTFDDALLQKVSSAFIRRRKAIAYHARLTCVRDFSESAAQVTEYISMTSGHTRLVIWADGGLCVGVFVHSQGRNAGWAFKDAFNGNMLDVSAETLVRMFEETRLLCYWPEQDRNQERLRRIWARIRPCNP
jgi:hypothetical protein